MKIHFWGVRGSIPTPGKSTATYGGNTSCVTLEFPKGEFFIFDAGTGIKELSNHIMAMRDGKLNAKIDLKFVESKMALEKFGFKSLF